MLKTRLAGPGLWAAKNAPLLHLSVHPVVPQELDHGGVVLGAVHLGLVAAAKKEQRQRLLVPRAAPKQKWARAGLGRCVRWV